MNRKNLFQGALYLFNLLIAAAGAAFITLSVRDGMGGIALFGLLLLSTSFLLHAIAKNQPTDWTTRSQATISDKRAA